MKLKSQITVIVLILGFIISSSVLSAEPLEPQKTPRLPEIQNELPPGTGFVPPRMDLSHLTGEKMPERTSTLDPPAQWDWRTQGKVTSMRNQGICGSCYAFAAVANFESKVLIDVVDTFDFSENNAKECNWYETSCDGGNYYKMASWFSKKGTVLESCDPYVASDVACNSSCSYIKTLLDWRIICTSSVPTTSVLKQYIYDNGPVYTSIYAGSGSDPSWESEFGSYDGSYTLYYTGSYATNHAVLIIGWDDDLSHAGGAGAWIVRNSWGASWGGPCGFGSEDGYFAIAYGSANIGMWSSYVYNWQDYDSNGDILYYDEGGWSNSWGYSSTTGWGLCKFVPSSNTYLTKVEVWTTDVTTDIDVYIYDDFDGSNLTNLLTSKENSSFTEAGYHSIALTTPLALTSSDDIYVKVKFANSSDQHPIASDYQGPFETAKTYISSTGNDGSWYDLGTGQSEDVAIRIRTSTDVGIDDKSRLEPPRSFLVTNNYPNPFNAQTTIEYGLPITSHVIIEVYNILGRKIETLVDENQQTGYHKINWNAENIPSGTYFYRIKAGEFAEVRKMVILK